MKGGLSQNVEAAAADLKKMLKEKAVAMKAKRPMKIRASIMRR